MSLNCSYVQPDSASGRRHVAWTNISQAERCRARSAKKSGAAWARTRSYCAPSINSHPMTSNTARRLACYVPSTKNRPVVGSTGAPEPCFVVRSLPCYRVRFPRAGSAWRYPVAASAGLPHVTIELGSVTLGRATPPYWLPMSGNDGQQPLPIPNPPLGRTGRQSPCCSLGAAGPRADRNFG